VASPLIHLFFPSSFFFLRKEKGGRSELKTASFQSLSLLPPLVEVGPRRSLLFLLLGVNGRGKDAGPGSNCLSSFSLLFFFFFFLKCWDVVHPWTARIFLVSPPLSPFSFFPFQGTDCCQWPEVAQQVPAVPPFFSSSNGISRNPGMGRLSFFCLPFSPSSSFGQEFRVWFVLLFCFPPFFFLFFSPLFFSWERVVV